ncbi:hypothetical protein HDU96_005243 [Phlyctochytrium bullatum]|nr:hypothetical protein HDU96_005243 [Phlyctochytrium bullatum]
MSAFSGAQLQRRGVALLNLQITGMRTGLGGATLVDFELATELAGTAFPSNRFKVGDLVGLDEHKAQGKGPAQPRGKGGGGKGESKDTGPLATGVVSRMRDAVATVAFRDELPDYLVEKASARFRLTLLGNEVTYKRMLDVLTELERKYSATSPPSHLAAILGLASPSFTRDVELTAFDPNLNDSQLEAVRLALKAQDLAIIHGPPGTGKTQTVIEVIRQLVARDQRVLVCGPSNTSVDTIVERLGRHRIPLVRVGHPARVKAEVLEHSLELRIRHSDEGQLVADVKTDLDNALASIQKAKGREKRKEAYNELRVRERNVLGNIIRNSKVVLATLSGAASSKLRNEVFDVVVIDEGSQAIEVECWIAITKAKKLILAGDNKQLPPTVKSGKSAATSQKGKKPGHPFTLDFTLFDRLLMMHGEEIKRLLSVQYRMHDLIMQYSSKVLYGNKLTAADAVKGHLLKDLPGVQDCDESQAPLLLISTSEAGMDESPEIAGDSSESGATSEIGVESLLNRGEAELVCGHVEKLVAAGVPSVSIAVITPYSAQWIHFKALKRKQ